MHSCYDLILQALLCVRGHEGSFRKSAIEYKHYGIKLFPSIYGIMVNHQCVYTPSYT
jgi:hypothetical protein